MNDIRRLLKNLAWFLGRETAGIVAWNYERLRASGHVLLPPPRPDQSLGVYHLGNVVWNARRVGKFGLQERELSEHIGIFGRTGAGKTNCVLLFTDVTQL